MGWFLRRRECALAVRAPLPKSAAGGGPEQVMGKLRTGARRGERRQPFTHYVAYKDSAQELCGANGSHHLQSYVVAGNPLWCEPHHHALVAAQLDAAADRDVLSVDVG